MEKKNQLSLFNEIGKIIQKLRKSSVIFTVLGVNKLPVSCTKIYGLQYPVYEVTHHGNVGLDFKETTRCIKNEFVIQVTEH